MVGIPGGGGLGCPGGSVRCLVAGGEPSPELRPESSVSSWTKGVSGEP